MPPTRAIDMHAHASVPAVDALVRGQEGRRRADAEAARGTTPASIDHNRSLGPVYAPKLTDLATRLADMDAMGVDVQAVSIAPPQYHYWADADLAGRLVAAANAHIAELVAQAPDRLVGLATVSPQHPVLAVEQLGHAVESLGLRGLMVSTRVGEMELADPSLEPLWARAEALGAVVFIHPMGCSLGERIAPYYLSNVIGNPAETTVALSLLIFGGVLDRHPGLKIVAAHGGGYLPFYAARSDHGWEVRPEARTCAEPPSTYLRRIWFDSLVYTPTQLRHLVEQVSASRVVLGTDYPYDMGVTDPLATLGAVEGLSEGERDAIRGANAAGLLGI